MFRNITYFFISNRINALTMSLAIWLAVSVSVQQSAAQSTLNVWQSNGPNANINKVVVDPHNPNIIYAGSSSGVFKSVNNGASWFMVNQIGVWDLSLDYVNPDTIYATTNSGVFKSTNGGVNWNGLNSPNQSRVVEVFKKNSKQSKFNRRRRFQ
jgi:hypothetical protein